MRDPAGRWFVSLRVELTDVPKWAMTKETVGVDLGLIDFAVLSTGERIAHPHHMEARERRLKRYQRQLARKRRGSANRVKAAKRVARQHARVGDARRDFLHKASTDLVRRFDAIAVEDLPVRALIHHKPVARSVSRSGWGTFRAMLAYKAERYGRTLVVVDRFYPSSKTCSECGHLLPSSLNLWIREWTCSKCGTRHDRDLNAAKNIRAAAGLAADACGGGVRRHEFAQSQSPAKQEGRKATSGSRFRP